MNQPVIKRVALNQYEWNLAYTIIRVCENTVNEYNFSSPEHRTLHDKTLIARNHADGSKTVCQEYTNDERIRMRRYVTDYCANLHDNWHQMLPVLTPFMIKLKELELVTIYKIAMAVLTSFSSL